MKNYKNQGKSKDANRKHLKMNPLLLLAASKYKYLLKVIFLKLL